MRTRFLALCCILPVLITTGAWGFLGHYVTGEIAKTHLTDDARAEVERVLGDMSIPESTVWMDRVRSTPEYNHTADWHWVTVPEFESYEESEKNPNGDIIQALERKIDMLKSGDLNEDEKRDALRMVIHMVGDIHQPMHVGDGTDRGGNDVAVEWMGRESNLHRVWDTDMIESLGLEYDQLANAINHPTPEQIETWQKATVRVWARESAHYRAQGYELPPDHAIGWSYRNEHLPLVEQRLLQAGVRLAGVLNDIFDPDGTPPHMDDDS